LTLVGALIALAAPSAALADPALPTMSVPGLSTVVSGEPFTVEGTGESGAEIRLFDNSTPAGTTTVLGNGTWTAQITAVDGDNDLSADEYVEAALVGSASAHALGVGAPPVDDPGTGQHVLATFPISGTGLDGAAVTIADAADEVIGTAVVDGDCGCWTTTTTVPLDYGSQDLHVTQTLNTVTGHPTIRTVDVRPAPPTFTGPADGDAVTAGDVTFTGTGTPGADIEIHEYGGDQVVSGTVGPTGDFSLVGELVPGQIYLTATQTVGGTQSDEAIAIFLFVDPPVPTIDAIDPATVKSGTTVTVTGTGYKGASITLRNNLNEVDTATVTPGGTWTASFEAGAYGDPDNYLSADQYLGVDYANSTTSDTYVASVAPPAVYSPADGDPVGPTFPLFGDAAPGAAITVKDDEGHVIGIGTADTCGCWDVTTTVPLGYGTRTIHVTQTLDTVTSDDTPISVDVTPEAPVLTTPADMDTVDPGSVHFTGTGVAGATITIETDEGDPIASGTIGIDGTFDVEGTITDLGYQYVVARQTASGATSDDSDVRVFLVDERDPTLQLDDTGPILSGDTVHVSGTGVPGLTISVQDTYDLSEVATATVQSNGTWSAGFPARDGFTTYVAVQQGVTDRYSDPLDVDVVFAPFVDTPQDGDDVRPGFTISGYAYDASDVTIKEGATLLATLHPDDSCGCMTWEYDTSPELSAGPHTFAITQNVDGDDLTTTLHVTIDPQALVVDSPLDYDLVPYGANHVTGTAKPGATVTVYQEPSATPLGTAIADVDDGAFNVTVNLATPGEQTLKVTQTPSGGNESGPVHVHVYVAMAPPTFTLSAATVAEGDDIVLTGMAEPDAAVVVFDNGDPVDGVLADPSTGVWTSTIPAVDGDNAISALQIGNEGAGPDFSGPSDEQHVLGVGAPPVDKPAPGDRVREDVRIEGTSLPGATLTVTDEHAVDLGAPVIGDDGDWHLNATLPFGAHTIHVTQTIDRVTGPATSVSFDVTPAPPVVTSPTASADNPVHFAGTADANATITVTDQADDSEVATTTAGGDGTWAVDATLAPGDHVFAVIQTVAATVDSDPTAVTTRVRLPAPTQQITGAATVRTGATVAVTGTGVPTATVTVRDNGTIVDTAVVDGGGDWSAELGAVDGDNAITSTQATTTSSSPASGALHVTGVSAPTVGLPAADANVAPTFGMSGQALANAVITVTADGGTAVGGTTAGADGAWALTTTGALPGGPHTLHVTQTFDSVTSVATDHQVTVRIAPAITTDPGAADVDAGATATFTAAASGYPAPTVQWQRSTNGLDWNDVGGATSATYSFTAAAGDDGARFRAVFTNAVSTATSAVATLAVRYAPVVTTDPVSQTKLAGESVTFTAAATGNTSPTVRWQVSTDNGGNWTDVDGATSPSYTFTTAAGQNGNRYRAVFHNQLGDTPSTAATLTVRVAPLVTTDPLSQAKLAGETATFTAAASGQPPATVQWQRSNDGGATWNDIGGATSGTYAFATAAGDDGARFRAVFTNAASAATSAVATLAVRVAPSVTAQPADRSVTAGEGASFTAAGAGQPAPTVQWQRSDDGGASWSDVGGAAGTTLTLASTATSDDGARFRAVFTNAAGSAASGAAKLSVAAVVEQPPTGTGTTSTPSTMTSTPGTTTTTPPPPPPPPPVAKPAALRATFTAKTKKVRRGRTSVLTITVQNTGGTAAAKVRVCTKPAAKATFVKRSPGATVKKKPASVCWTIASLGPGAKASKTLTVKVAPSAPLKPIALSATAAIDTAKPVTAKVRLTVKR